MSLQLPCYDTVLFRVGYLICSARPSKRCVALRRLAVRAHRSDRGESEGEQEGCAPARLRGARRGRGPAAQKKKKKEKKRKRGKNKKKRRKKKKLRRDNDNIELVNDRGTDGGAPRVGSLSAPRLSEEKRRYFRTRWLPDSAFPGIRILP